MHPKQKTVSILASYCEYFFLKIFSALNSIVPLQGPPEGHSLYQSFSFDVTRCHSLSLDVSLVCLLINGLAFLYLIILIETF